MKIEKEPLEDHQVKLIVEVDPEPYDAAKQRAARKLAKRVKIPGFRPGKAPYPVIVRHIGEGAIVEEAIEILVNDIYPQAIEEAEIEPYSLGTLENISNMDPPTFEFVIPLKAEVELGDYKAIRLPYDQPEITETDVDDVVANLQERQAIIDPVEQPAEEGNLIRIRLDGEKANPVEGESSTIVDNREYPVVIEGEDADTTGEWPFPGFSRQLLGLSAGDEKELDYTFPEDSDYENLQGEDATFRISVEQVSTRTLPELDDEFASSVGDHANMEELRVLVREDLEQHAENSYNEEYDEKLIEEVISISTIEYPPQMLEHEIESVINRLAGNLSQQGLDIDLYLKSRQMDMDALKEEVTPVAETRLHKSLTLLEIADEENIQVDPDDLQAATNRTLDELSNVMEEKEFRKMLQTDETRNNLVGNVMMEMLIDRTQTRLRDIARGQVADENDEDEEEQVEDVEVDTKAEIEQVDIEDANAEEIDVEEVDVDDEEQQPEIDPEQSESEGTPDAAAQDETETATGTQPADQAEAEEPVEIDQQMDG